MNEVMTLAEDLGVSIWYQDTDSMHINYEEVSLLATEFKNKYDKDLIGDYMSHFHIDCDLDGACGEIYSNESYFLAKKVYIDKLESVDKNGNTIGSTSNQTRISTVNVPACHGGCCMPTWHIRDKKGAHQATISGGSCCV